MTQRKNSRIEEIPLTENSIGDLFDISEDGIGYHSESEYSEGDVLDVQLNELKLRARVIYCRPMNTGAHIGLKYIDLLSAQAEALYEVVTAISKGAPSEFVILTKDK